MDQVVELERIDLARVEAGDPLADSPDQLRKLSLVIRADGGSRSPAFGLRWSVRRHRPPTLRRCPREALDCRRVLAAGVRDVARRVALAGSIASQRPCAAGCSRAAPSA
jgi:hypothetical protein